VLLQMISKYLSVCDRSLNCVRSLKKACHRTLSEIAFLLMFNLHVAFNGETEQNILSDLNHILLLCVLVLVIEAEKLEVQYCAKVMRAKCANFILCLHELSEKICPKIRASFHNVLSVISLKQRMKLCSIFKTRTKIPYQRDNSVCEISQCSALTSIGPSMYCSLVNNRGHVDALLLYKIHCC